MNSAFFFFMIVLCTPEFPTEGAGAGDRKGRLVLWRRLGEGKVVLRECRCKTGGSAVSSVRGLCCHNRGSFTGSAEMLERNKEAERVDMGSLSERDGKKKMKQVRYQAPETVACCTTL